LTPSLLAGLVESPLIFDMADCLSAKLVASVDCCTYYVGVMPCVMWVWLRQRHILQLTSDNSLRNCLEELEDEQLSQSDIVQDCKKLGRRKMVSLLILSNGG